MEISIDNPTPFINESKACSTTKEERLLSELLYKIIPIGINPMTSAKRREICFLIIQTISDFKMIVLPVNKLSI
ncbi:MAG: hypothetical protein ACD_79C01498G0002 [uncultured bacterium]|nr:MAG: hypothetical protein ACD_79C01498G0002 [uncultured bacterium]